MSELVNLGRIKMKAMTQHNKSLFILYAALNQYGYDIHDLPEYDPTRKKIRAILSKLQKEPAVESYFKCAHRPDICKEHPFWPFVCLLSNTVFILQERNGLFLKPAKGALENHFAPYTNDFPIKLGKKEFSYLSALPEALNSFTKTSPIEDMWALYKQSVSLPPGAEEMFRRDIKWFNRHFPSVSRFSFGLLFNFLERENYGGIISVGSEVGIISGPAECYPKSLVRHEITHTAFEPLLKSIKDISRFKPLIIPGKEALKRNGYWGHDSKSSVLKVLQDTFARALCCHLARKDGDPIEKRLLWDKESGFLLVEKIIPKLETLIGNNRPLKGKDLENMLLEIPGH